MSVVTVTLTSSEAELSSGIPETVTVTVNVTATVYYTLDGSLPTVLSAVYSGPIAMPTDVNSVTLSVVAYYLDEFSALVPTAVLSQIYRPDWSGLDDRDRYLNFEGIVYSFPGGADIPFYYDESGSVVFSIDLPAEDLDIILSDYDYLGNFIGTDDDVEPVPPDETPSRVDNDKTRFSTPSDVNFDPEALYILVDSRPGAPTPIVDLVNGPFMSLRNATTSYGGIELRNHLGENYVSGDAVRPMVNREKGIVVFNYFDSNTGRWVKSVGPLAAAPTAVTTPVATQPLVFSWVNFGRQQAF